MAFKIYFNKKTGHPSISLSGKEKDRWENMKMTHNPTQKHSYIDIVTISKNGSTKSCVRKYIRKDKKGVKGKLHKNTKLSNKSEVKIKEYLKYRNKKDDGKL